MKFVPIQCPCCNANLSADIEKNIKVMYCGHCGTQIYIDDEVQRYEYTHRYEYTQKNEYTHRVINDAEIKKAEAEMKKAEIEVKKAQIEMMQSEIDRKKDNASNIYGIIVLILGMGFFIGFWILIHGGFGH